MPHFAESSGPLPTALTGALGRNRAFYDEWYEARLLGSGGDLKLQDCYKQAELVVPFFSEHYTKPWSRSSSRT